MKQMTKVFLPFFFLLAISFSLAAPTFAAVESDSSIDPQASILFTQKNVNSAKKENGLVSFSYYVAATGVMDRLGVTQVKIYEQAGSGSFTHVYTYNLSNKPNMMKSNVASVNSLVNYQGTSGNYYKAEITFQAIKNGYSESSILSTPPIKAT